MSVKSLSFGALSAAAGAAALIALAPIAAAEPIEPVGGGQSPGQTVKDLTNQGYDVQLNWVDGMPDVVPLSQCTVTNINTEDGKKAYVSVSCPPAGSQ